MGGTSTRTSRHLRLLLPVLLLASATLAPIPAAGQPPTYHFTRIADTNDNAGLGGVSCIGLNNQGTVIVSFVPTGARLQLWRGTGVPGSFVAVADIANLCPSINDAGETAYLVFDPTTTVVTLVRNTNGVLTPLATSSAPPFVDGSSNGSYTPLNNTGNVAFVTRSVVGVQLAGVRVAPAGLFVYDGSTGALNTFGAPATINDTNVAAFQGTRIVNSAQRTGIYRSSTTPLVEDGSVTSAGTLGVFFGQRPVINNSGTVAFQATANGGASSIFTTQDGVNLTLVGTNPVDRIAMNNDGVVAFRRNLGGPITGIYVGRPGSVNERVIGPGDALDGSTFQDGFIWEDGINDRGQVAFYAFLADGRRGVYRADPADATPPVISNVPDDIVAEATSAAGAAVNYGQPSALDDRDGPVTVECAPASGSVFALGQTTVNCHASDAAANTATATFNVLVRDTTPPIISNVPGNVTVTATDAGGIAVTFTQPTATDLVSGAVAVACTPSSGSVFPIGTTNVNCTASDVAGNAATATFSVTVLGSPTRRLSGSGYHFPESPTYRATFNIDVRGPSSPTGTVQYVYTRTRMTFASTAITAVSITGSTVNVSGTGSVNGAGGYTFSVTAVDGSPDTFQISIFRPGDGSLFFAGTGPLGGGSLILTP